MRTSRNETTKAVEDRRGLLKVSQVAAIVGVTASTLRLWERHGLIEPARSASKQRLYTEDVVNRARDIMRMRAIQGLNISAIKRVLSKDATLSGNTLGTRLRNLRNAAKMTLRDVERETGLAYSFISALEKTSNGSSMTSLQKLARCYGTTVTELMDVNSGRADEIIVRAGSGKKIPILGPSVSIEQLTNAIGTLDCQKWSLEPGASSDGPYSHEGEEFIFVLRGVLALNIEGYGDVRVEAGDSLNFKSTRPHSWNNPSKDFTQVLWISTPSSF